MKSINLPPMAFILANTLLAGCTSLLAHNAIEPYTKNKQARNELEFKAEEFCRLKRSTTDSQPDYIFTTDGCSRWPDDSWLVCCVVHDISYWCGGSDTDRLTADRELKDCVNNRTAIMGNIMYSGIRAGGLPWLPTPWRWGYGWDNWPENYEPNTIGPALGDLLRDLKVYEVVERHLMEIGK